MTDSSQMSKEDGLALLAKLQADPAVAELLRQEPEIPATETGAAVAIPYTLGGRPVPPACAGTFLALSLIDSPLLGRLDECEDIDAYRALYIACHGAEVLAPIMGYHQRRERLTEIKSMIDGKPEMLVVYLAQVDAIERTTWGEFDRKTLAFVQTFGNVTPAEILETLFLILRDARAGMAQIPHEPGEPEDDSEKKKRDRASTSRGWLRYKHTRAALSDFLRLRWLGKSRLRPSET